jgi:hypothetical protein
MSLLGVVTVTNRDAVDQNNLSQMHFRLSQNLQNCLFNLIKTKNGSLTFKNRSTIKTFDENPAEIMLNIV